MIWELLVQLAAAFGATVGFAVLVTRCPGNLSGRA